MLKETKRKMAVIMKFQLNHLQACEITQGEQRAWDLACQVVETQISGKIKKLKIFV